MNPKHVVVAVYLSTFMLAAAIAGVWWWWIVAAVYGLITLYGIVD